LSVGIWMVGMCLGNAMLKHTLFLSLAVDACVQFKGMHAQIDYWESVIVCFYSSFILFIDLQFKLHTHKRSFHLAGGIKYRPDLLDDQLCSLFIRKEEGALCVLQSSKAHAYFDDR